MQSYLIWSAFLVFSLNSMRCQMPKKPPILPLVKDIPFIQCDVCQKAAKTLFKSVKAKREQIKPMKLGEDDILTIVEGTCDPDSTYGEWIRHYDIVEKEDSLKLQEHSVKGKCREECKTIAKSCEQSIGDIDTDVSEILWKDELKLSKFLNKVCYDMSKSCKKKKPKYIAGKRKDYKFKEMTEKDEAAEEMMKNMKGMPGMPGLSMYDPEDLQNMRDEMGIDDKTVEEYRKKHGKAGESEQESATSQQNSQKEAEPANLGLMDTVKAAGQDVYGKVKGMFGSDDTKTEL